MYKECNLIIFLAVKLGAAWEQLSGDKAAQQQGHSPRDSRLCLQPIALAFVLLSQLPFFFLYFNPDQYKFSFPEGILWGKHWDAVGIAWLIQPVLKTLFAKIPHWTTGIKNWPNYIAWVQPCTLSPLLDAPLAQKELAVAWGKQMWPHKNRGHHSLRRGL